MASTRRLCALATARDSKPDAPNKNNMATQPMEHASTGTRQLAGKYLTFILHDESYGIDVLKVREIIRLTTITAVPQMPDYVRGVINLRGKIIPVMDLRLRFGFAEAANTEQTCIIVVQVKLSDGKTTQMGLVVDGVEEVLNIAAADIEETPDFGGQIATHYIVGMAKVKGAVKTLLDIDGVVSAEALKKLKLPATASATSQNR
jgi:purine-binding chemotaxis protein CheW